MGFPNILIPWVVLQELDFLKRGKGLSGSVAHLAIPAISYVYNILKNREPRLWGQSMQQAAESSSKCSFRLLFGLPTAFQVGLIYYNQGYNQKVSRVYCPISTRLCWVFSVKHIAGKTSFTQGGGVGFLKKM